MQYTRDGILGGGGAIGGDGQEGSTLLVVGWGGAGGKGCWLLL